MELDEKTKSLIAVSAAVSANCIPCFRWHYKHSIQLGVSKEILKQTIDIAKVIKSMPIKLFNEASTKTVVKFDKNS